MVIFGSRSYRNINANPGDVQVNSSSKTQVSVWSCSRIILFSTDSDFFYRSFFMGSLSRTSFFLGIWIAFMILVLGFFVVGLASFNQ